MHAYLGEVWRRLPVSPAPMKKENSNKKKEKERETATHSHANSIAKKTTTRELKKRGGRAEVKPRQWERAATKTKNSHRILVFFLAPSLVCLLACCALQKDPCMPPPPIPLLLACARRLDGMGCGTDGRMDGWLCE